MFIVFDEVTIKYQQKHLYLLSITIVLLNYLAKTAKK